MTDNIERTDEEIKKVMEADDSGGFFQMIAKKVKKLSQEKQDWIEDKIWQIYQQAKGEEEETSTDKQTTRERSSFGFIYELTGHKN